MVYFQGGFMAEKKYPATLTIDYQEKADRLTAFFRGFVAVPILIIFAFVAGPVNDESWFVAHKYYYAAGGFIFIPTILMLLFRHKYPKWWYDWNINLLQFGLRVISYLLLLTHEYPSTDEEQSVHLDIPYPDAKKELSKGMPLIKWFFTIPHLFILAFLWTAVVFITIVAWLAILFTGNYPKGMWEFTVGVLRWTIRVDAYCFLLTTDEYPPFSLD